ncbi:hypothetical protein D3C78_982860 [compost metagenome]
MLSIRMRSPLVQPFCTSAEKPPIKLTPTSLAALSKISATGTYVSVFTAPAAIAIGVTEIRLLTIGTPNCLSRSSPVLTSFSADLVILSYTFWLKVLISVCAQSMRLIPIVIVRTSRFISRIILFVSCTSTSDIMVILLNAVHNIKNILMLKLDFHADLFSDQM